MKSEAILCGLSAAYIVISNKLSHSTKIEGKIREKGAKKIFNFPRHDSQNHKYKAYTFYSRFFQR